MKKIISLVALATTISLAAQAQFTQAKLKANGLTCSMCSFATQKQLKTISFIDSIGTDLNNTTFILYFKKNAVINSQLIKQKVQDAGFAVGMLVYSIEFKKEVLTNNQFKYNNTTYVIHSPNITTLNGNVEFKVIDKEFVTAKEFKKYKKQIASTTGNSYVNVIIQ